MKHCKKSNLLSELPNISHGFFGRHGGTSPGQWRSLNTAYGEDVASRVDENRSRICASLGVDPKHLYTPAQVHGTTTKYIPRPTQWGEGRVRGEADAIWTNEPGVALGIQTADCVPILMASANGKVVAAIHAGWRGAVGGVIESALKTLQVEAQIHPSEWIAAIGPCIGFESYEVGEEVVANVKDEFPSLVKPISPGKFLFNLPGLCRAKLAQAGVARIEVLPHCTYKEVADFFSHRADKGKSGRQLSVIAIT